LRIDEALDMMDSRYERKREVRVNKAKDYANEDCLANFKTMAKLAKVLEDAGMPIPISKPEGVALWHLLHKYVRILNLTKKGKAVNEPIDDSFTDLENYSELALECLKDG